jgi:cell division protein ZapA
MTQRIEVNIMGQGYVLASSDGDEQAVRAAAQRVDGAMCKVRDAGKIKARDRIAVLAGLNLAFELEQAPAAPQPTPYPTATWPACASSWPNLTAPWATTVSCCKQPYNT